MADARSADEEPSRATSAAPGVRIAPGLCIDCRSVSRHDRCPHDARHRVLSATLHDWRARWMRVVWGPPDARLQARRLIKAGGSGAGLGAVLEMGTCAEGIASGPVILVLLGAFVFGLAYWVLTFIWRNVLAYRKRIKPRGATHKLPRLRGREQFRGRVIEARTNLLSPGTTRHCVAYAVELCAESHELSAVMLRHSHAAPFSVRLEDGSLAVLPAGPLRLHGVQRQRDANEAVLNAVDHDLAPHPDDLPPVPFDYVREILLIRGDRVALHGEWEREPLEAEGPNPYRQAARYRYRPIGLPQIAVLADQQD